MLQFEKLQYSRLPQKSLPKYLVVLIGAVITLVKVFDMLLMQLVQLQAFVVF
ncbi:hypothetical protein S101520_01749 [Lactiplantibacillus plantarum subsp. plantarum]|nr:hypothetical protein S101520_01749 [Lactiplantibacillus plantarum subsp. plantarum]